MVRPNIYHNHDKTLSTLLHLFRMARCRRASGLCRSQEDEGEHQL